MKGLIKENSKGITLIALVVTIIVLIILAGISINAVIGDNGIITKSKLAKFATEMQSIKENVEFKKGTNALEFIQGNGKNIFEEKVNVNNIKIEETLKKEILYTREGYPSDKEINNYSEEEFNNLLDGEGNIKDFYIIDKKTGNGKENTYIWDLVSNVVFKIPQTEIGGQIYHSYELATKQKGAQNKDEEEENIGSDLMIDKDSDVVQVGEDYYYAPNMKGFNSDNTKLVYYSQDLKSTKEIPVKEYIENGEQPQITKDGQVYILHNYKEKIWANVKTTANDIECWWVWIPRYAYKANGTSTEPPMDIIYVDVNNKPLNPKYNGVLPDGYEIHSGFTTKEGDTVNELKGIWMSKYEPSYATTYSSPSTKSLAPDMEGFNEENTYIELYDANTKKFTQEVLLKDANLATINDGNAWYDYENQIWANIKTTANDIECWWVWIPRYAYNIIEGSKDLNVIFIGLDNKPLDKAVYGENLPQGYMPHPAFTTVDDAGDKKELKGIWMSKYEPSYATTYTSPSTKCLPPNMEGFNDENTYIELYNYSTKKFGKEVLLKDANLDTINNNNEWYDYENQIWANVKTKANDIECWWVWIPRYAYNIIEGSKDLNIIFVGLDNKPIDKAIYGENLPEGYMVHPGFTTKEGDTVNELKGIWMSKYEPSYVSDTIAGTTPTGGTSLQYSSDQAGNNHTHLGNGCGTKLRYVTSSTKWCSAYDGTPCSNDGYYIYCSLCGVRMRHYWCANHYNPDTKVIIEDENVN